MNKLERALDLQAKVLHWGSKLGVRWVKGKRVVGTSRRGRHYARHYHWILKREVEGE